MRRTERHIYAYDLVVGSRAQNAPPTPVRELIAAWQTMYDEGQCSHEREKGSVVYRIGDIDIDEQESIARILIRRCDTNAANAVYSHRQTGVPRVAEKEEDEGGDRAAHLVISMNEESASPGHYLCHLEGVPGLSHRLVQATLNAVLKDAIREDHAVFQYPDPNGARVRGGGRKMHSHYPIVELEGHVSQALVRDIEDGEISDVVLVASQPRNNLGGNRYLVEKEKTLRVTVDSGLPRRNRVDAMIAAFQAKAGFQTAKVRFKDPSGQTRTIDYDIATGSPEQQNYIRSYVIDGINPPMDESCVTLSPFLADAMKAHVIAERS